MSNIDKLKESFTEVFGLDASEIEWDSLEYRGIPEWDSIAHMAIIAEIEDAFDIMLETDDVIAMTSFKIAQDLVAKYGVEFD